MRDDDPTSDPPTGDVLRTYRLALITDPGYATFFGGSANVTPAKVALMNRVSQIYEDDLSIRLQLIDNNDLLNLDTWDLAIAPNGPCGAAGCFTQAQVTGCSSTARARFVIGQIIGASNYDIGHLALGQPGGGVANLGVVGRSNKAGGCTGIPTPVGDFYAVDYVAHEMGHQFSSGLANSGGGMMTFFSPFQVQIGGNSSALIGGSGLPYNNANIQSAINAIPGFAGSVTASGAASTGFTLSYAGASAGLDVPNIELVNLSCGGCFASVQETNHGGASDSFVLNYNGNLSAPSSTA